MNLPALVLLYASDVSPFAINGSTNVSTNMSTNVSTNVSTNRHTNVRARDYKEKLTALQYYNTCCNITIRKKHGETIASGRRQKLVFVEEINQINDKKHPFHRGNGLKKHLPKHGVSLIELLRRMVFLGRVHCTQLDFS